ncbi:hypothetical protein BpHYR1_034740 [Brachionus plicatilis]|uniref:Uncharacterized protein n=1 Tax=Brachionus plicatilis TaxID=10195 RepID=A0A3M7PF33_BRAPC|nr:hypothetical protein BpHYR1_034740 [Brachionus plicatilis]
MYFTGLLLHGIPGINWFDFKNQLNKKTFLNVNCSCLLSSNENETFLYIWFRFKLEEDCKNYKKIKSCQIDLERSHVKKLDFEIDLTLKRL